MKAIVTSLFSVLLLSFAIKSNAQLDSAVITREVWGFQNELNKEYKSEKDSPLPPEQRKQFKSHSFFPISMQYVVVAKFVRTPSEQVFKMPTSGAKTPEYVKYGEAHFTLLGKPYKLNLYQSLDLAKTEQYKNHLFLPFRDSTSGKQTYGGGRYIDLTIPAGDTIVINFNKAYHPYCAYVEGYNCPIPPRENFLPLPVYAGIRFNKN